MYRTVTVEVEIDLADIDIEDLEEELERRGKDSVSGDVSLDEIYYALKFSREDAALDLMRRYVCNNLGRVL